MARHLLDLGHRDVAFITPPLTRRQWQRSKRVNGFVKEFEKEGLRDHVIIKAADESIDPESPEWIPSIPWAISLPWNCFRRAADSLPSPVRMI